MLRHYLYLIVCSTRNRVRRQLQRLRNPRYAIAALAGLGYFYLIFGRPAAGQHELGTQYIAVARAVGPLFLALLAAWWWLWGGHRAGLVLTPAETHLLVPAPVTRRSLVRLKILQAQVPIIFSAVLVALVTRGVVVSGPRRFLSLWLLLATLHLHQIAASLVHAAADEQGSSGVRRQLVPLLLFGAAFVTLALSLARAILEIRHTPRFDFAIERIAALSQEPAPRVVLTPFRLLLEPLTTTAAEAWLPAFLTALLVGIAHYLWVQRTDAAFEEVAGREGEKRAAHAAAVRSGGTTRLVFSRLHRAKKLTRPLLPLRPLGAPAYALLWKNLLYAQRLIRPRTVIVLLIALLLLLSPSLFDGSAPGRVLSRTGYLLLLFGGMMTVLGPFAIRNDLRMDLPVIATLRTYPLNGRGVVAAEVTAAAAVVVLIQQPLILGGLLLLSAAGVVTLPQLLIAIPAAVLGLPAVAAIAVVIQNALALLYPGWVRLGQAGSGGMEAVGQNLLTMIGTLLLLVLTAVPPLIAAIAVGALFLPLSQLAAAIAGGLTLITAVAAEVVLLTLWLGRLYDRTDPVAAGLLS